MILRYPSPVPVGATVVDYLAERREPLIEALSTVLNTVLSIGAPVSVYQDAAPGTCELLQTTDGEDTLYRTEMIMAEHDGRWCVYGIAVGAILSERLTLATRLVEVLATDPREQAWAPLIRLRRDLIDDRSTEFSRDRRFLLSAGIGAPLALCLESLPIRDGTDLNPWPFPQPPTPRRVRTGSRWAGPVAGCRTPGADR